MSHMKRLYTELQESGNLGYYLEHSRRVRDLEDREHHRVSELEAELADTKNDRDSFWDAYVDAREQLEEARAEIVRLTEELQVNQMLQADIYEGDF